MQDLLAGYDCSCPGGFSGTNCDQEENSGEGVRRVVTVVREWGGR